MTGIAIKADPIRNAPSWKRKILRYAIQKNLDLGEPVVFTDGTDEYFVFDDHRLDLDAVTDIAVLIKKLNSLTLSDLPKDEENNVDVSKVRNAISNFVGVDRSEVASRSLEDDEDIVDGVARLANVAQVMRSVSGLSPVIVDNVDVE